MKRSALAFLAFTLAVAVSVAVGSTLRPGSDAAPSPAYLPDATEVVGSGPELACMGCIAGGVLVWAGGPLRWFKAAITKGSSLALVGCATTCAAAVGLVE